MERERPADAASTRLSGVVAGRFETLGPIGKGSTARVERVRDRFDGSLYALKWAPRRDPDQVWSLRREYRIRLDLVHPRIPAVLRFGDDRERGLLWMLSELAPGVEAGPRVLDRPSRIRHALSQALSVLAFLHRRGVVHGDVKPQNMRVSCAGDAVDLRLLDFGLSRETRDARAPVGGTPKYLAPSVRRGRRPGPASDLHSLAIAFDELLDARADDAEARELRRFVRGLREDHPGRRFLSADEALRSLAHEFGEPVPAAYAVGDHPAFAGREAELEIVEGKVRELLRGNLRTNLLLVRGASGSGKSRFLREALRRMLFEFDVDPSLHIVGAEGFRGVALDLAHRYLDRDDPLIAAIEDPRHVLTQADTACLGRALARHPHPRGFTAVLLDAAGTGAADCAAPLASLRSQGGSRGPLIVVACGDESPLARLSDDERTVTIDLKPLERAETEALIRSLLPEPSRDAAPELARLSGGHPRTATLLAGARAGDLSPTGPKGARLLDRALSARIGTLDRAHRDVLMTLAVLGEPAPARLIEQVSGFEGAASILRELARQGLARVAVESRERTYAIAGPELARVVLRRGRRRIAALHERALAALTSGKAWNASAERVAHHALGSGRREAWKRVVPAAMEQLARQGRHDDVARLGEKLLGLASGVDSRIADSLLRLAEAWIRTGRPQKCIPTLESLLSRADLAVAVRFRARMLLGWADECRGDPERAIRRFCACLEQEEAALVPPEDRRRLLERLGATALRLGDLDRARRAFEEGLAIPSDCDRTTADLHQDLGVCCLRSGEIGRARDHYRQALRIRRRIADADGEARALTALANLELRARRFAEGAALYARALVAIEDAIGGATPMRALLLRNRSVCLRLQGDLAGAMTAARESVRLRRRLGDRSEEMLARAQLASILVERGELGEAGAELDRMRAAGAESSDLGVAIEQVEADYWFAVGDLDRGRERIEAALSRRDMEPAIRSSLLILLAKLLRIADAPAGAEAPLTEALAIGRSEADPWALACALREHAEYMISKEDWRNAQRSIDEALALARSLRARRPLTESLVTAATFRLRRGEADRAWSCLREALSHAELHAGVDLLAEVWIARGFHALHCGQPSRALSCLATGAELWVDVASSLARRELEALYLNRRDRRTVGTRIDELIGLLDPPRESRMANHARP